MPNGSLAKLRVLTEALAGQDMPSAANEYMLSSRGAVIRSLHKEPEVRCRQVFMPAGMSAQRHYIAERELIVVYKGSLFYTEDGKPERRIASGRCVGVAPSVPHSYRCEEDCWFVDVLFPRNTGI